MKLINRNFYSNAEDEQGVIWRFLRCVEKIAYYQFSNKYPDIADLFCNNTNIVLTEKEDYLQFTSGYFKAEPLFYSLKQYTNVESPINLICNLIDEEKIVGFNTQFSHIPNYNDYLSKLERTRSHYAMLVGYDDKYFYVADSPFLLHSEFREKNMLTKVDREILVQEFDKQCNLMTAELNPDWDGINVDINELICKIIAECEAEPKVCEDSIRRSGQAAMTRLYELVMNEDIRLHSANLFLSPFPASVIRGRRIMLKWYLEKHLSEFSSELVTCACRLIITLENCADMWQAISNSALRRELKNKAYLPSQGFMTELCGYEEELNNRLKEFVKLGYMVQIEETIGQTI